MALLLRRRLRLEELPPGTHEAVPGDELVPEPGDRVAGVDRVEPEGDLGQLDGGGIQVDAVDVVVGQVGLDLLLLEEEVVVRDPGSRLSLLPFEKRLCQLVDRLVGESAAPERRLADRHREDVVGRPLLQQLLQRVLDDAARENLGGVVRRALLAIPPGEAVDEGPLRVPLQPPVEELLLVGVLRQVGRLHEPGVLQLVVLLPLAAHLVELLLGEEAGVREEPLVNGSELVDPELRVADAAAPPLASPLLRPGEREALEDLLEDVVAEADPAERRGPLRVEEVTPQGLHPEGVTVAVLPLRNLLLRDLLLRDLLLRNQHGLPLPVAEPLVDEPE